VPLVAPNLSRAEISPITEQSKSEPEHCAAPSLTVPLSGPYLYEYKSPFCFCAKPQFRCRPFIFRGPLLLQYETETWIPCNKTHDIVLCTTASNGEHTY